MPEYMYKCQSCGEAFSLVLSLPERAEKERRGEIQCPKCKSTEVEHTMESFYAKTDRKS